MIVTEKKIRKNLLVAGPLLFSLLVTPLNYPIVAQLRLNDFLIIIAIGLFFILNRSFQGKALLALSALISILLLSSFVGAIHGSGNLYLTSVLVYKHSLIFLLYFLFDELLRREVIRPATIVNIAFLALISCLIFAYWSYFTVEAASRHFRLSFPGTNLVNNGATDAHAFSFFLSTLLIISQVAYYLKLGFRPPAIMNMVIIVSAIVVLLYTGSRTGVLCVGMFLCSFLFLQILSGAKIRMSSLLLFFSSICGVLIIILAALAAQSQMNLVNMMPERMEPNLLRALNFDFADTSIFMRIEFNLAVFSFVFEKMAGLGSIGIFLHKGVFVDGAIASVLLYMGIIGIVFWIYIIIKYITCELSACSPLIKRIAEAFLICIIASFIVTEYYLLTRCIIFPIGFLVTLKYIDNPRQKKNVGTRIC